MAQTAGPAYSCDGTFYQTRQVAIGANFHSQLFRVNRNVTPAADPSTTVYTTTLVQDLATGLGLPATTDFVVNSLAYNPLDGYMYALTYPVNNSATYPEIHLYRIGQTGVQDIGRITINGSVPAQYPQLAAGVIDKDGQYYATARNLASATNKNNLFRLNLNQSSDAAKLNAVTVPMDFYTTASPNTVVTPASTQDFSFIDIGLNPADNQLYGIYSAGSVYKFDFMTTPGRARVTRIGAAPATAPNFGSVSFDLVGNMFAYSNEGDFYSVNIATGAATDIGNVPTAGVTDGASCVNPSQRIDVVKEVTGVTFVSGTTYDVAFAIRVKNTGTVTATNVQVSDFLRGAANNTTFPTSTSVAISGLAVTNTGGALAANTGYTGQAGNADLLTGSEPLSAGQSALITFTARVVFPTSAVPTTAQNNTAYASSTAGTAANPGYALQTTDGSLILPPGDLVAVDASTNSAALPLTPNGDVASPSPVYFQTAILGNVFEDINYGGGAGRSQAASNGEGVFQARVELYSSSVAGAYLGFTTTDAAGNYSFINGVNGISLSANTNYRVRVVNTSVVSNRPGSIAGLVPVQTFLNGNVNRVGGENPNQTDAAQNSGNQTLNTLEAQSTSTTVQTLTTVTTPASGPLVGVDFGFNFDTVVNTNASGQGSLSQFITNSNTLTNANLTQAYTGAIAGQEAAIFMLNDGRLTGAPAGLRNGMTAVTGYSALTRVFTITPTAALPTILDDNTTINGARQTAITGDNVAATAETSTGAEVVINFNSLAGLLVTGGSTRIENLGLNNARGTSTATSGAVTADGAGVTFSGAATTGSVVNLVTTAGNATAGVRLQNGATGVTVSNSVLNGSVATGTVNGEGLVLAGAARNTISGNTISNNSGFGVLLESGQANNENTISGNIIRNNGGGANVEDAGLVIGGGNNNLVSQNTFTGNASNAIIAAAGTSGNRFTQNSMSNNTGNGIDLMASGTTGLAGDGLTRNDNTDADTGANGLLNFPVISQAVTNGGNLIITGYAPAGSLVELFVADVQADGFGEGKTYLSSWTEGSAQDGDTRTGGYSGLVSGVNQGSETATSLFMFSVSIASLTPAQQAALTANGARLTATATTLTTVNSLVVGNTSEFSGNTALLQNRPLPVELVRFSAVANNTNAVLSWTTASEKNNARFVIERSLDGKDFQAVGTLAGQGTSTQSRSYQFVDERAAAAANLVYYRLRQQDTDGTSSLSAVQAVRFNGNTSNTPVIGLYPNPTTANASLDLRSLPAGTVQVRLTDLTGRVLSTATVPTGQVYTLASAQLPQGSYLVTVVNGNQKTTQRLVKQ
ncbi:T9SS type A sorting domain-containing protein [Hymenobacter sp. BT186]|uniref:T9SS type A sorting domain-containing protein n=1 Tax=Hymenobacter telluris TaxID=2816474 RepID=A0A939EXS8_9BACT|nr:right-handed parallel beta-helix repeat-containing protein [Hymenobacter telluris]MBO0359403.1 T9SS type A sorting domain-containing protein [Hymenobacter telluris]MBW3375429.1 T9SS type A sorting domain-containing protein [Hymenobacter norwichensis]